MAPVSALASRATACISAPLAPGNSSRAASLRRLAPLPTGAPNGWLGRESMELRGSAGNTVGHRQRGSRARSRPSLDAVSQDKAKDMPALYSDDKVDNFLSASSLMEDDVQPSVEEMSTKIHSLILAGGASNNPLARYRAVAAIPLGCTYRMVDVPISNCMASGITKMYVLTQYMNASLNNHVATAYRPATFGGQSKRGWVEILATTQTPSRNQWSAGSADAVRWHLQTIFSPECGEESPSHLLVLSGQALYNMDFRDLIALHKRSEADVTIATQSVSRERAEHLGVARVSQESGQVTAFAEKPEREALDQFAHASVYSTADEPFEASMGIYVFRREVLEDLLLGDDSFAAPKQDIHFGRDVIPHALRAGYRVFAHHFNGYWKDVSRLRDYYEANLAFTNADTPFSPASLEGFMHAEPKMLPPAIISNSEINSSLIGAGSWVIGSSVTTSVIGQSASIAAGCTIEDSLILGADFNQQDPRKRPSNMEECDSLDFLGIGKNCEIRRAIIDKNAFIGENSRIVNVDSVEEADCSDQGYVIQDGIVTILKNAIIPAGTVI